MQGGYFDIQGLTGKQGYGKISLPFALLRTYYVHGFTKTGDEMDNRHCLVLAKQYVISPLNAVTCEANPGSG